MKNIEFLVRNYINIFILKKDDKIPFLVGGGKKHFTVEYKDHIYTFERLIDDKNKYILYSYDNTNSNCVILVVNKKEKIINISSLGSLEKCYCDEIDIGSNLLQITLKMIKKYKEYFDINKIILKDNSTYQCIKGLIKDDTRKYNGPTLNLGKMLTLLTGNTWYGNKGFRPYTPEYILDSFRNKSYQENLNKMNTIKLKEVDFKKYLLLIAKKYPKKFTDIEINKLLKLIEENKEILLKNFLNKFHSKDNFNSTCRYLYEYYEVLFKDLNLNNIDGLYGLEI